MTLAVTFRSLESDADRRLIADSGNSPLESWYRRVRDTPLDKLNSGDLSRACRQQLYPTAVVPIAIAKIEKEPLAGELYDGELLVALKSVSRDYWSAHSAEAFGIASIAKSILEQVDPDTKGEISALLSALGVVIY
jgi:hypothetical protein